MRDVRVSNRIDIDFTHGTYTSYTDIVFVVMNMLDLPASTHAIIAKRSDTFSFIHDPPLCYISSFFG